MALVVADRVQETTSNAAGTSGSYTLDGAKAGFQSFAAVGDGNTTYYACTDGTDYEVGIGTYTASGTTLARTTIIESSNSNAAVNWGSTTKDIFVTLPASKAIFEDASNNISVGNNITVGGTVDGVDIASRDSVLSSTTTTANNAMPKTGGTFTGDVIFDGSTAGRDITFDRSENALTFEDSAEIKLGTNNDLRIYHDGLNNYWKGSSGYNYIDYQQSGGVYIRGDHNGTGTYELTAVFSEANMVFYSSGIERLRINNNAPGVEVQSGLSVDTGDIDIASGALEIGGSVAIPSSFGANGTVLTSNGTSASWQTPSGGSGSLTVQDEGTSLTTDASILNFTGNGVVASGTGSTKTIAINGQLSYDPNPQLGGNLNLASYEVISNTNDDVIFNPGGSGQVVLKGNSTRGAGQFVLNCEQNTHGITIKGPPHSAAATYTLTLPDTDGNSSEFLQTDGSGNLSWATATSYTHPNHTGEVTSTGDGATVIADDVVDEANLKVSNTPTDGYVLTARSGNTGGMTWEAASGGIALTDLSVTQNAASGSGTLSYDNTSGVFSYTPPVISGGGGGSTASALTEQEFTATAGQTVFSVTGGITNADNVVVFLNGSRLFSTDVTVSDTANTVTLAAGATVGDLVTVSEFGAAFGSQYSSSIFTVGTSSEYNTSTKVLTTPYTANRVAVYLNGVKLLVGSSNDFTATDGSTINLTNAAPVTGDTIEVVEHGTLADTVTTLTGLSDTPSSLGTAGQILQVNSGATALEFADASAGVTTGKAIAMAIVFGG